MSLQLEFFIKFLNSITDKIFLRSFSLLSSFINISLHIFMDIFFVWRWFIFVSRGVNINEFEHFTVLESESLLVLRLVPIQNNIFLVILNCYFNCQRGLADLTSAEVGYFVFNLFLLFDFFYFLIHEQSRFQFQPDEIIFMLKI